MVELRRIEKILVIKLRAVGDVLLSTIVLKNLRNHFPEAQIDFLTEPASREILEGNRTINNLLIFNPGSDKSLSFLWRLRRSGYDLVLDLFGNPRTALMTYSTRARYRVGFAFRGRQYAYNIHVPPRGGAVHNTEFNLDALRALEIEIIDREITFDIPRRDQEYVDAFLRREKLGGDGLIGINPSGTWYTKRWGLKKFAKLGDKLTEAYGGRVILLWGPWEENEARQIKEMMRHPSIIPPRTTLKQLGAFLKRCAFVVSNDAGPMHLSAVLGVPTLGIYGPTNPYTQGPIGERNVWVRLEGLDCLGCNLTSCPIGHPCMDRLSVDAVTRAGEELVEKNQILITA